MTKSKGAANPAAHISSICAACKRAWPLEVEQAIANNQLIWRERFACSCGHGFEASGVGLPTPGVRRALLETWGSAKAWVDAAKSKPHVVKTLAMLQGLSETETAGVFKKLPAVAYEGTVVEVEFVAAALRRASAKVRIVAAPLKKQARAKARK